MRMGQEFSNGMWRVAIGMGWTALFLCIVVVGKAAADSLWLARGANVVGYGTEGVVPASVSALATNAFGLAILWRGRQHRIAPGMAALAASAVLVIISARYYNILFIPSAALWAVAGLIYLLRTPNAVSNQGD